MGSTKVMEGLKLDSQNLLLWGMEKHCKHIKNTPNEDFMPVDGREICSKLKPLGKWSHAAVLYLLFQNVKNIWGTSVFYILPRRETEIYGNGVTKRAVAHESECREGLDSVYHDKCDERERGSWDS